MFSTKKPEASRFDNSGSCPSPDVLGGEAVVLVSDLLVQQHRVGVTALPYNAVFHRRRGQAHHPRSDEAEDYPGQNLPLTCFLHPGDLA